MKQGSWWAIFLVCCVALSITGCSLIKSTKAKGDVQQAKQTGVQKDEQIVQERKWEHYASDRRMVDYYYDKESATFPSKAVVRAWRRRVFPPRSPQKEIISYDEVDCNNARFRSLETEAVYWNGTTRAFKVISPWIPMYEGTPDELFLVDRCREARQGP